MTMHQISAKTYWINFLATLLVCIGLTACTTSGHAIPQGGLTMAQVYEEAMQQSKGTTLEQARNAVQPLTLNPNDNHFAYSRTMENEINNLFPQLPNPQLTMYVYPHLAGFDQAPVPGYATAFPLYDKVHYALPGEIATL